MIHGFELLKEETIEEMNLYGQLYRHVQSGAHVLSLQNDDENKVFGVSFRTPPTDSTGLPHIMEHCVLCGSHKYPLKEPFVELLKGSLQTFLNAMTFPDKTTYPVASQNLQDFYNLVDIYLDAVLHPLIHEHHLHQEGWHYELENLEDPLIYKGVVFNEMKGAYSSPDSLLYRYSGQALMPDTPYGVDSGGDPKDIPDLTYEQFKKFHATYYHPANGAFYFYGDDDPTERLRILDNYLKDFKVIDVDSSIALQPYFTTPRYMTYPYGIDGEEGEDAKYYVTIDWLLPENDDPALTMGLSLLSHALVETSASPLYKILTDSGLGEDVIAGGLSTWTRQMSFSVGMKGLSMENARKVEPLVLETLEKMVAEGFDAERVEASLNTIEFMLRENNTGSYPRGLLLMLRALSTWNYDRDPFVGLAYDAPLQALKEKLQTDKNYLQDLMRQYLLENPHRSVITLAPDPDLNQREAEEEKQRLEAAQSAMSTDDLQSIIDLTNELKEIQETPDSAEALASLPNLALSDLDGQNKLIPLEKSESKGSQILYHDLATNGIIYLDVGLNLHLLPADLLPYVKLFGETLTEMGTSSENFVTLAQRIGRKTGGIYATTYTSSRYGVDEATSWLFVRGKATLDKGQDLLEIVQDVLLNVNLDNQERFHQLVLEAKAGSEARLIPSGHNVAAARLGSYFSEAGWASEQMSGIENLFFLRQLADDVQNDWPAVLAKLEQIRQILLNRNAMVCNVTLDGQGWSTFEPQLASFLDELPASSAQLANWSPTLQPRNEGLTIPAQVNYVGKGANLYNLGYQPHGSISVINNYIRTSWLWEQVRMKGGAYGCMMGFSRRSGILNFRSYRDPNLLETLNVYNECSRFLHNLDLTDDELTKGIIGVIGSIDDYQLPDTKGYTSLTRYLAGDTDEQLQEWRDQVLSTTAADFQAFVDVLERVNEQGNVAILGSNDALMQANEERGGDWLTISKVM